MLLSMTGPHKFKINEHILNESKQGSEWQIRPLHMLLFMLIEITHETFEENKEVREAKHKSNLRLKFSL